jgi:hypothetical protein
MARSKRRALGEVWAWLKANLHRSLGEQQWGLAQRLNGHYGYFAIRGNMNSVWSFWDAVRRAWRWWLSRRSDKAGVTWSRFHKILDRFPLPEPALTVRSERTA